MNLRHDLLFAPQSFARPGQAARSVKPDELAYRLWMAEMDDRDDAMNESATNGQGMEIEQFDGGEVSGQGSDEYRK